MFFQWRSLQVMLLTGACHKTACYRNGYIKTLSTPIKKEKLPFYTRKIMISLSGNQKCMSWFSCMVCILVKHNTEASVHDRGGLFFCVPPSFPVSPCSHVTIARQGEQRKHSCFLHSPWRGTALVIYPSKGIKCHGNIVLKQIAF